MIFIWNKFQNKHTPISLFITLNFIYEQGQFLISNCNVKKKRNMMTIIKRKKMSSG